MVALCGLSTRSYTSQIMEELSKTFQKSVEKEERKSDVLQVVNRSIQEINIDQQNMTRPRKAQETPLHCLQTWIEFCGNLAMLKGWTHGIFM